MFSHDNTSQMITHLSDYHPVCYLRRDGLPNGRRLELHTYTTRLVNMYITVDRKIWLDPSALQHESYKPARLHMDPGLESMARRTGRETSRLIPFSR